MPNAGTTALSRQRTSPALSRTIVSTSPTTAWVARLLSKSDCGIQAELSYV